MLLTRSSLITLLLLSAILVRSQTPTYSKTGLELDGKDIQILVESLPNDAKKFGVTEDRIKTKCELRLRLVGLNLVDVWRSPPAVLYINVSAVGNAFSIDLYFDRTLNFMVGAKEMFKDNVPTWHEDILGTDNGESDYVIQALDVLLDKFLNDLLKANPSLSGSK